MPLVVKASNLRLLMTECNLIKASLEAEFKKSLFLDLICWCLVKVTLIVFKFTHSSYFPVIFPKMGARRHTMSTVCLMSFQCFLTKQCCGIHNVVQSEKAISYGSKNSELSLIPNMLVKSKTEINAAR